MKYSSCNKNKDPVERSSNLLTIVTAWDTKKIASIEAVNPLKLPKSTLLWKSQRNFKSCFSSNRMVTSAKSEIKGRKPHWANFEEERLNNLLDMNLGSKTSIKNCLSRVWAMVGITFLKKCFTHYKKTRKFNGRIRVFTKPIKVGMGTKFEQLIKCLAAEILISKKIWDSWTNNNFKSQDKLFPEIKNGVKLEPTKNLEVRPKSRLIEIRHSLKVDVPEVFDRSQIESAYPRRATDSRNVNLKISRQKIETPEFFNRRKKKRKKIIIMKKKKVRTYDKNADAS